MFSNIIDLLNYILCCKKYFFISNILPPGIFLNVIIKWAPLIGFWIKIIFLFLFLHFTPSGTTNNLPLLNALNRPTLM